MRQNRWDFLGMIVEAESANPGLQADQFLPAQNCDHFGIAELGAGDSPVYQSVSEFLKSSVQSVQPQVCTEVGASVVQLALVAA